MTDSVAPPQAYEGTRPYYDEIFDRDGQPRLDGNGKPVYSQIVEFKDKATADRFAELVLGLIRRENPDALDGGQ